MRSIIFKIVLVVLAGGNCAAKTLYVDVNGPNNPGTGSYEDPFLRIQDAIDSADSNDTVIVAQGHYCENIGIDVNNIVLTSTDPNNPEVVSKTIIDGNDAGLVITFTGLGGPKAVLSGLTITNGYANYGGGIYCFNNSSPKITNCTITGNGAGGYGGGIYCFNNSSPTISNCIITGNSAEYGGGIACVLGNPVITNCAITNNWANYGGGIAAVHSSPIMTNCTITDNTAGSDGSALACNSSEQQYPSNVQMTNCILWNGGNEIWNNDASMITISYSDVYGGWPGDDNIDDGPLLEPDGYHLMPDSPCISMGDPLGNYNNQVDIDGEPRVVGAFVDAGCDEFLMVGDLDYNDCIDWADLAILIRDWLQDGDDRAADFNHDETVDFGDFALFARNWLQQFE